MATESGTRGARMAAAVVVSAVLLAGCSSTSAPRAAPGAAGVPPALPAGAAEAGSANGTLAPRGGGYYLDDGPGNLQPAELQALLSLPEPVPVAEPLHRWANRPYRVMGNDYRPMTRLEPFVERGVASWYGRRFHGRPTSIGESYDMYGLTAAHPTLPLPSYVRVTNLENARSVIVRVNDRGPFLHGRAIDLSFLAASRLGYVRNGSAQVEVELLHPQAPASPAAVQPHYLQLGAFAAPAGAEAASARLRQQLQWLQVPIEVQPHGSVYRVWAGPFAQREQATRAGAEVESRTGLRPVLVPAPPDQPVSGPGW